MAKKESGETDVATQDGDKGETTASEAQPRQQLNVEDGGAVTSYANFCRVTGTPEELIIDVGLNAHPVGPQSEAIVINQRLVMNYYTAKRLLGALSMSIQRHEQAFGVLETDIQRRVQPQARPST